MDKPKSEEKSKGKPKKLGRPSQYRREYNLQARKLCKLGAIDEDLADFFKVSVVTLNAWKKRYPSFLKSLKAGKQDPDDQVEQALLQRALGYEHDEDKIFNADGIPLIVPTVKHYPPDTAACFIWLKNRQPGDWRDKQEIELSGSINLITDDDDKNL